MKNMRGYATLELKSFGETSKGFIAGRLSHIDVDRSGDVVIPSGLKFKLPIPLRFEHKDTIGHIVKAEVTETGLDIEAQLSDPDEAQSQTIKERLLTAWDSVRMGLARGLSVGMIPLKSEPMGNGYGRKFLSAELIEGSIVSIPDNARATISVVKSYALRSMPPGFVRLDGETIRKHTRSDGVVYL